MRVRARSRTSDDESCTVLETSPAALNTSSISAASTCSQEVIFLEMGSALISFITT